MILGPALNVINDKRCANADRVAVLHIAGHIQLQRSIVSESLIALAVVGPIHILDAINSALVSRQAKAGSFNRGIILDHIGYAVGEGAAAAGRADIEGATDTPVLRFASAEGYHHLQAAALRLGVKRAAEIGDKLGCKCIAHLVG